MLPLTTSWFSTSKIQGSLTTNTHSKTHRLLLTQLRDQAQPRRKERLKSELKENRLVFQGLWMKKASFPLPGIMKNIDK
jgi:hypothetical protein